MIRREKNQLNVKKKDGIFWRSPKLIKEEQTVNSSTLLRAYLQQAETYSAQGQWKQAIALYSQAREQNPQNPTVHYLLGKALANGQEWEQAIASYQKATQLQPNHWEAYHHWGDALINQEKWREAVTAYRRALEIKPDFEWSYCNLGEALVQLQQWEEAVAAYQKAIEINPNLEWVPQKLGNALYRLGEELTFRRKWNEAIATYQKARELNPDLPFIYRQLGNVFHQRSIADRVIVLDYYRRMVRQHPDQEEYFHKLLELQPQEAELYFGLGNALEKQGKLDQAIVTYQMGLQLQPNNIKASRRLEQILDRTGKLSNLEKAKKKLEKKTTKKLENFLASGYQLNFPEVKQPAVSIILVLYNRAELTLSCLASIAQNKFKSYEVIIIDNCSTDQTRMLLERVKGAKIVFNQENRHFLLACNQASKIATGKFLLFLNNDAEILGNSIQIAVRTIKSAKEIGAVGGKIILADGTLQEAGSIIWQDGSCLGYGRGDQPNAPQYMFKRSVDYCSGAFLLTKRDLFEEMGGFDEAYQPAYYEETDYCVKLLKAGKKIIYHPKVRINHYEFASSSSSQKAIELQKRNRQLFKEKHQDWLRWQYPAELKNIIFARTAKEKRERILFIDDRVPHPFMGSGYTRGYGILSRMVKLGYNVTFYPSDLGSQEDWGKIYSDISLEVEVMKGYGLEDLEKFLRSRHGYYDLVFVSRPHNMEKINYILSPENFLAGVKIVYDAEALYCLRELDQKRLRGEKVSAREREKLIKEELKLGSNSDCIVSVSEGERQQFINYGYKKVTVLGHAVEVKPTANRFEKRQNILFVGAIYERESPNFDSILWLSKEIFPLIQEQLGKGVKLVIAGTNTIEQVGKLVNDLGNEAIEVLGRVDDLTQLYNQAKFFVAPTRYAAGIPHKVHEAVGRGLPVVTTPLIAQQLGWKPELELLVGDRAAKFASQCVRLYNDAELWAKIRNNGLKRVKTECSPDAFTETLREILAISKS
ncbi:MAG: tetratricopeptide repeat protein [Gomphosphaeria aponina SAG 52.96 = DSM 107014]|uniref:Tetratricopeptide repeat protein n=1 Tax=Gomphosphaeria aponina SAG 52.96 = DSM 107014 TaxID=1521640 RepID=A0A941JRM4_9CHRO|nr:tetratricopeptide repeat protein [Gomphosphaeria aponina SAG 52.96 = DSM 107014]